MKNLLFVFSLILSGQFVFAQAISSTIDHVTVFRQNAEITRKASVQLKKGKQEIIVSGLSTQVNPSSVQVKLSGSGVTLLSAKFLNNYLKNREESPEIVELYAEIENLKAEVDWINDQMSILNDLEEVLKKNQVLGGRDQGFTAAQVMELVSAQKSKLLEIKKEKRTLKNQAKVIKKKKIKIKKQLNELNAVQDRPTGNIVLMVQSERALTTNLSCSYVVSGAGWSPLYDLRSAGITQNVQLFYKGNIYQNTGQDWEDIAITISTGNPTVNNNRPILSPLYAGFKIENDYLKDRRIENKKSNMRLSEDKLEEVSVTMDAGYDYGATINTNQITIEYELPGRHTLKSDGKENLLALKTYDLSTDYVYHTVPKLDKGAFLLAKISDWGKYNLEAGEANIFFEGAYIGNTFINSDVTSDELLVSMGRDNSIVVTRKRAVDFTKKKFITFRLNWCFFVIFTN